MPRKNNQRSSSPLYWSAETWAFISLRLFLGFRFLFAGLEKFSGNEAINGLAFSNYYDGFVSSLIQRFETTILPGFIVTPYIYMIAYAEIVIGLMVLLGVKTKYALALTGLTYVTLAFGEMILKNGSSVTAIGTHLLITAAALYFVRHNKLEALR